jgi:Kinesin motor domain
VLFSGCSVLCSTSHDSIIAHSPADIFSLPAAGLTLTEAQNINRSLLELGNVISALMQTAPHVPYRSAPALPIIGCSIRSYACKLSPMRINSSTST